MPPTGHRLTSEDAFLDLIHRHFPNAHARVPLMRGDDAAILDTPGRVCLTSDLFLENAHFRRAYFSPGDIGFKALAVNLSDIAAMGARPLGFCLGLMVPDTLEGLDETFWDELMHDMAALALRHDCPLVGGDLNRAPLLGLAVTAWGEAGRFLLRGQANPGDALFTLGNIGLARSGLHVLEQHGRAAIRLYPAATQAHLRPSLHMEAGPTLAAMPGVRGLMDLSDGLARDLPRFLGPALGADIALGPGAIHPETAAVARLAGQDPARWAMLGGEDYALLGACAPDALPGLIARLPDARPIGTVTAAPGIRLNGETFLAPGFDHFQR